MDHFALLDDAHRGSATLLTGLRDVEEVSFSTIDGALEAGWGNSWHCFAWLPYDAPHALFWFDTRQEVDPLVWLPGRPAWVADPAQDVTRGQFAARVAEVQEAIAAGTCYQINYTHRVHGRLVGDAPSLYRRLRERQSVALGVLAHLPRPAAEWTLSLSPELFLQVEHGVALSRPMKGTAPASSDPEQLRTDPKNRAENLMIVDLIRNDLSRVADDVAVPALFDVERVGQLWQMTSTVTGRLRSDAGVGDLLRATFPCGSITGAPKLAAMDLIRQVERDERGLYTGSMGLIEPDRLTLNIAIRTLEIDAERRIRMGVGSGIVADSTAESEWEECLAKAAFVTALAPDVHLKEAMRVVDGGAPLADLHRERLASASAALGFTLRGDPVGAAVAATAPGAWRIAIDVAPNGDHTVVRTALPETAQPVTLRLADRPWTPSELSHYKTTDRSHLDDAVAAATADGAFDTIGFDRHGRVLEGGRTNVFARVDGRWLTPPLALGLLGGVQRKAVLADPSLLGADTISEDTLTIADLLRADEVVVTNAVRGVLRARIEE